MLKPINLLEEILIEIENNLKENIDIDYLAEKFSLSERHYIFANVSVTIEINNINPNGGIIYDYVFYSERAYKNQSADLTFHVNPAASTVLHGINLPEGECLITIFQDMNGNGILDLNFF